MNQDDKLRHDCTPESQALFEIMTSTLDREDICPSCYSMEVLMASIEFAIGVLRAKGAPDKVIVEVMFRTVAKVLNGTIDGDVGVLKVSRDDDETPERMH